MRKRRLAGSDEKVSDVRSRMDVSPACDLCGRLVRVNREQLLVRGRTMGKDAFPAAPGEGGREVCLVRGLIVAEPDLGWK